MTKLEILQELKGLKIQIDKNLRGVSVNSDILAERFNRLLELLGELLKE